MSFVVDFGMFTTVMPVSTEYSLAYRYVTLSVAAGVISFGATGALIGPMLLALTRACYDMLVGKMEDAEEWEQSRLPHQKTT
jgi:predicted PurR-regulated permease PerM